MLYQKESLENLKINLIEGGYIPKVEFINLFGKARIDFYSEVLKEGISQIEKDGDFSVLEREIEDYLINLIRPAKYMFFGPEPVFGYCLAKENELKSLKLIFLAKINNLPNLEIQERLASAYA
jgi:V/A-type H+-transporting ATPase subunit C